jgi:hypothetical protein
MIPASELAVDTDCVGCGGGRPIKVFIHGVLRAWLYLIAGSRVARVSLDGGADGVDRADAVGGGGVQVAFIRHQWARVRKVCQ